MNKRENTTVVRGKVVSISSLPRAVVSKMKPEPKLKLVRSKSALSKALSEFNREPMLEPHEIPVQSILWRILVQPLPPLKANPGGKIELAKTTQDAEEVSTSVGRVLQLGHFAFKSTTQAGLKLDEEPFKPKVGDFVLHQTYAGQEIRLRSGKKLRILLDTEVLAIVTDPDEIRAYI